MVKSKRYDMTMSRTVIKSRCLNVFLGNPKTQKVKHREAQRARRGKREENERETRRKREENEKRDLGLAKGFENEIQRPFDRYGLEFASDVGVNITHGVLFRITRGAVF